MKFIGQVGIIFVVLVALLDWPKYSSCLPVFGDHLFPDDPYSEKAVPVPLKNKLRMLKLKSPYADGFDDGYGNKLYAHNFPFSSGFTKKLRANKPTDFHSAGQLAALDRVLLNPHAHFNSELLSDVFLPRNSFESARNLRNTFNRPSQQQQYGNEFNSEMAPMDLLEPMPMRQGIRQLSALRHNPKVEENIENQDFKMSVKRKYFDDDLDEFDARSEPERIEQSEIVFRPSEIPSQSEQSKTNTYETSSVDTSVEQISNENYQQPVTEIKKEKADLETEVIKRLSFKKPSVKDEVDPITQLKEDNERTTVDTQQTTSNLEETSQKSNVNSDFKTIDVDDLAKILNKYKDLKVEEFLKNDISDVVKTYYESYQNDKNSINNFLASPEVLALKETVPTFQIIDNRESTNPVLVAEKNVAEEKVAEVTVAEEKLVEQKLADPIVSEKVAEETGAEQKVTEEIVTQGTEQKLAEEIVTQGAEQKVTEEIVTQGAEQKLAEEIVTQGAEQKVAETENRSEENIVKDPITEEKEQLSLNLESHVAAHHTTSASTSSTDDVAYNYIPYGNGGVIVINNLSKKDQISEILKGQGVDVTQETQGGIPVSLSKTEIDRLLTSAVIINSSNTEKQQWLGLI